MNHQHHHIRPLVSWRVEVADRTGFTQFKAADDFGMALDVAGKTVKGKIVRVYRAPKVLSSNTVPVITGQIKADGLTYLQVEGEVCNG